MRDQNRNPGGRQSKVAYLLWKWAGISRDDIAEVLEVHPTEISRWFSGARQANAAALVETVLWLRGHNPDLINETDTAELAAGELADLQLAFQALRLCEAAYVERTPGAVSRW
jgi:hypothetical protein